MDSDLTQFNGTPVFVPTADVDTNAEPFLVPTGGKLITADNNGANQAPVNRSIKRLKNLIDGIRGAIFGDFAGAVPRSVKSLQVDLTGGAVSVAPDGTILVQGTHGTPSIDAYDGDIQAQQGSFHSLIGNLLLDLGSAVIQGNATVGGFFQAGSAQLTQHSKVGLKWIGTLTGSADANPPQNTAIPNQLLAKNIPKCSAFVRMSAPNVIADYDGYGIQTVAINASPFVMDVTFTSAFANTKYTLGTSAFQLGAETYLVSEIVASRTTTTTQIYAVSIQTGGSLDFSATAASFSVHFDGQQNT